MTAALGLVNSSETTDQLQDPLPSRMWMIIEVKVHYKKPQNETFKPLWPSVKNKMAATLLTESLKLPWVDTCDTKATESVRF